MSTNEFTPESLEPFSQFYLERVEDVNGKSGTGIVARGCILPSGKCILEWQTFNSSVCIYNNIQDVHTIHNHEGKTKVMMGSPEEKPKRKTRKKKL